MTWRGLYNTCAHEGHTCYNSNMHRVVPELILENYRAGRFSGEFPAVGMFLDLSGFSKMTDTLMQHGQHGAEVLASLMYGVFDPLVRNIFEYGGRIVSFAGDGIMALFGAPIALEDAPQRAIRSIHRGMAKFNQKLKQEKDNIPPLKMRIGVHTGPVVVGTLGNDLRVEFKAVGDTVNLASRMEGLAEPGTT